MCFPALGIVGKKEGKQALPLFPAEEKEAKKKEAFFGMQAVQDFAAPAKELSRLNWWQAFLVALALVALTVALLWVLWPASVEKIVGVAENLVVAVQGLTGFLLNRN